MEIIVVFEDLLCGVYIGVFGYFDCSGDMDFNIFICMLI